MSGPTEIRGQLGTVIPAGRRRRWFADSSNGMGLGNTTLTQAIRFVITEHRRGHTARISRSPQNIPTTHKEPSA